MAKDELLVAPGTTSPGSPIPGVLVPAFFFQKDGALVAKPYQIDVNNVPSCRCTYVFHIEIEICLGGGISKYCRRQLL